MATLADQKAALEAALASGASRVRFDGREVEYRSVEELKSALAHVNSQLATVAGTPVTRLGHLATGKGLSGVGL